MSIRVWDRTTFQEKATILLRGNRYTTDLKEHPLDKNIFISTHSDKKKLLLWDTRCLSSRPKWVVVNFLIRSFLTYYNSAKIKLGFNAAAIECYQNKMVACTSGFARPDTGFPFFLSCYFFFLFFSGFIFYRGALPRLIWSSRYQ